MFAGIKYIFRGISCSCDPLLARDNDTVFSQSLITSKVQELRSGTSEDGFLVYYDNLSRNPLCTIEHLSRESLTGRRIQSKRPNFHPDQRIDHVFRVHPKDYNDSKYDRGHLIPAADFVKGNEILWSNTFLMSNISPQIPWLNKGLWMHLEQWIRNLILQHDYEDVMIFTGPVFAPSFVNNQWIYLHQTIGTFPRLIKIPSHFFKFIVAKKKIKDSKGKDCVLYSCATLMVPNSDRAKPLSSLNQVLVRLDQLESIVGFRILPHFTSEPAFIENVDAAVPSSRDLSVVLNENFPKALSEVESDSAQRFLALRKKPATVGKSGNLLYQHLCSSLTDECSKYLF